MGLAPIRSWAIISLGGTSPCLSCSLPRTSAQQRAGKRAASRAQAHFVPAWPCSWWGLPGRLHCCTRRWSLTRTQVRRFGSNRCLWHLFTLTSLAERSLGGLFLWPDPTGYPSPGVTRHRALWSADFPQLWLPEPRSPERPRVIPSYYHHSQSSISLDKSDLLK